MSEAIIKGKIETMNESEFLKDKITINNELTKDKLEEISLTSMIDDQTKRPSTISSKNSTINTNLNCLNVEMCKPNNPRRSKSKSPNKRLKVSVIENIAILKQQDSPFNEVKTSTVSNKCKIRGRKKKFSATSCFMCDTTLNLPFIICRECENCGICLECFQNGKENGSHHKNHKYSIMDNSFDLLADGWSCSDEKAISASYNLLTENITINDKSWNECIDHYNEVYVNNPTKYGLEKVVIDGREKAPEALTIKYWQFGESISNPFRPGHNKIESEYKYMNGMSHYHASRGEFGKEEQKLDEKILSEKYMANLNTGDDEWLKIDKRYNRALLKQYTLTLDEREESKQFYNNFDVLDLQRRCKFVSQLSEMGQLIEMKIQPTMQLHKNIDDYETTRRVMMQMAQVQTKIKTLQHYRDMGITTFEEAKTYDMLVNTKIVAQKFYNKKQTLAIKTTKACRTYGVGRRKRGSCLFNSPRRKSSHCSSPSTNRYGRSIQPPILHKDYATTSTLNSCQNDPDWEDLENSSVKSKSLNTPSRGRLKASYSVDSSRKRVRKSPDNEFFTPTAKPKKKKLPPGSCNVYRVKKKIDITVLDSFNDLSEAEQNFCLEYTFRPDLFLSWKSTLLKVQEQKGGELKLNDARTSLRIDKRKISVVYWHLVEQKLIVVPERSKLFGRKRHTSAVQVENDGKL